MLEALPVRMHLICPDPQEIAAARRGHVAAREALVTRCLPPVLQWCARLGGPKVDAEDAAHDVILVVLTRLDALREPEQFPSWLFGITRRVLAQHRRRAWLRRWVPGLVPDVPDWSMNPGQQAELSETSRRVQRALEDVPVDQRDVLVLCDLEERPDSEVADLLQIPLGTVRSRLRLGREHFRRAALRHQLSGVVVELRQRGRS